MNETIKKIKEKIEALTAETFDGKEPVTPTVFYRDDTLFVSGEDGGYFADYYGEYRGGYPWIDARLIKIATDAGMFWEWENPGCIGLYY